MAAYARDIRGLPLWLLREYLVELGGQAQDEVTVVGEGWTARLTRLPDYQIGSLRVGEVRLEVEGAADAVADVVARLEPRLVRAGGD